VTEAELRDGAPLDVGPPEAEGVSAAVPEDVRQLALAAIEVVSARLSS